MQTPCLRAVPWGQSVDSRALNRGELGNGVTAVIKRHGVWRKGHFRPLWGIRERLSHEVLGEQGFTRCDKTGRGFQKGGRCAHGREGTAEKRAGV